MKVRLIEGIARGEMIEIPKLKETIRISKLTIPNESGVHALLDGHDLQYKLSYPD